ncbi:MAG: molybdopterin biosynthesis protein MoeB [Firmicutes bacterium ADurb.Bin182]|nr:MAG: molybdopterin biosynthesis protein MoeB [Firmicutes bacterium ADurb.Bin182]
MKKLIKSILLILFIGFALLAVLSFIERSGTENLSETEKAILEAADKAMLQINSGDRNDDAEKALNDIKELIGNLNISPSKAKEEIERKTRYILLDVRSFEEFDKGHLPDSVCLPAPRLEDEAERVVGEKDKFVFVLGSSADESAGAVKLLRKLGYSKALDLGGIESWPYELFGGR